MTQKKSTGKNKKSTGKKKPLTAVAPPKLSTGIDGLDDILEGGLPENHIYLAEGEPGTGKTTLSLQFLREGARRGETVLYVTLSETKNELLEVARSHGWDIGDLNIFELVPSGESLKPESQYTIFHPSEIELNETTAAILAEVERINPSRVIFDSLSEMRLLARDPLRYRRQILALKQYFAPRNCTVLLLDDKTSDTKDLQVQSIVHGVIALEHLAVELCAERRRLRVIKLRGARFRGGHHDFNLETGGIRVFPRLVAASHASKTSNESLESEIPGMKELLGGGLDHGSSTLLIGPAGAGKSSLSTELAVSAAKKGKRAAIFVFDEMRETYIARAEGIGADIRKFIDDRLITVQQVDPAELSPGEFAHTIISAVKNDNAEVVVIDSLNGYLNAMPEERFLTIQMHELLTYLNQQGVVSILILGQHGILGDSISSPVDVSYLADTVLMLRYFETGGEVRRAISVVKKRTGAHENTIRELKISSSGITVGEPLKQFEGVLTGVPTFTGKRL